MKNPIRLHGILLFGSFLTLALLLGCATKHAPITTPMLCTCVIEHPDDWNTGTLDDPADCAVHGAETE